MVWDLFGMCISYLLCSYDWVNWISGSVADTGHCRICHSRLLSFWYSLNLEMRPNLCFHLSGDIAKSTTVFYSRRVLLLITSYGWWNCSSSMCLMKYSWIMSTHHFSTSLLDDPLPAPPLIIPSPVKTDCSKKRKQTVAFKGENAVNHFASWRFCKWFF